MLRAFRNHRHEIGIFVMFSAFLMIEILPLVSGLAWIYLDPDEFSFWMLVSVAMLAIVSGIVATYSFVQYTQESRLRSFIIMLLGANVVLLSFLYLITHPITTWSSFSDRQRNLTVVAALAFLVAPGVLGGSLVGHREVSPRSRNIVLLWGIVLQPFFSLALLMSPEPVFTLTGNGFANLSFMGWAVSIIFGFSAFLSLIRYLREWKRRHESIILASSLALVIWILSFLIFLAIDSPIQVAELLWFSGVAYGFVLLAATMIITSIVEPHRALESVVRERTTQLEKSREETEFYLRLWTHKIGNLLQGISTYLELIEYQAEEIPSLSEYQKLATDLLRESTSVNRQVERLIRIKENETSITWPISLSNVLTDFVKNMNEAKDGEIELELSNIDNQFQIVADDLIDIIFSNLISKCAKQHQGNGKKLSIRVKDDKKNIHVFLGPCSATSVAEVNVWSKNPTSMKYSVVDLELFMVWLLMERYGGSLEHQSNPNSHEGELVLTFKRAL